jgi:maleate isomerase
MAVDSHRVGLLVPSSNTTMETEVPAILRRHTELTGHGFTFHSARMRMKEVDPAQLAAMNRDADRAAAELADADVDVMAYACLVAVMAEGPGAHRHIEARLQGIAADNGARAEIVSSAGALIDGLRALGARRVSIITPYMKPLTNLVVAYLESEGVEVHDAISLEVPDNLAVGRLDPAQLPDLTDKLDTSGVDAVVLSACVQMPSLPAVPEAEHRTGLPVLTASLATAWRTLKALGHEPVSAGGGALLSGRHPAPDTATVIGERTP